MLLVKIFFVSFKLSEMFLHNDLLEPFAPPISSISTLLSNESWFTVVSVKLVMDLNSPSVSTLWERVN